MIQAQDIIAAVLKWPSRYETEAKEIVVGDAVSRVTTALREAGWRNVPRFDAYDLKQLGLRVVRAQYTGGARATGKFIDVVVVK